MPSAWLGYALELSLPAARSTARLAELFFKVCAWCRVSWRTRLRARCVARLAIVLFGFSAVPSAWLGYAPEVSVPAARSKVRLAAVPGGLVPAAAGEGPG